MMALQLSPIQAVLFLSIRRFKMHLTHKQFLALVAVIIASCGAWGVILKMLVDSSLALRWILFVWFFGGCIVAALVIAAIDITGALERKRHATPCRRIQDCKIKIEGDINPLLIAMKSKLTEVKQAAEKGIDRE